MSLDIRKTLDIHLEVGDVAKAFAAMSSDEMAVFFNLVAEEVGKWNGAFCMQMQWVTNDENLTKMGRSIMSQIGDYAEHII